MFAEVLAKRIERLRLANSARDARMLATNLVVNGHAERVFAGLFPSDWPKAVIANTIRASMEDTAMMVGVLPTLTAAGDSMLDDGKRSRSDKLTRIINAIAYQSNLGNGLVSAAAKLSAYGFVPLRVEPNMAEGRPHIHVDDPMGTYFERDRFNRIVSYSRTFRKRASEIAALYPEYRSLLVSRSILGDDDEWLDVIRFYDKDMTMLFVPRRNGLVLERLENPLGRVPVSLAILPTLDDDQHGQFDDALWVYAAKARLALLNLEAATKAVEAPIVAPMDMETFEFGPDAILRTNNPAGVRRVALDVPNSSMFEVGQLDNELKLASHYPDVRAGQTDASVVTGRGVQALMGGFDQRIKAAQSVLGAATGDALEISLQMDKLLFGDEAKKVYASTNGSAYELTYTPSRDVYSTNVSVEYGVMAGLDPNRALVWSLQALGAGLISETFVRRNLPININASEEEKLIDVEGLRKATMAAVQSYAQAIPQLAAQGQDPSEAIGRIGQILDDRKKGIPIEEAAAKAFAPKEPPPAPEQPPMPGQEQPQMPGQPQIQMPQQPPSQAQLLSQLTGDGQERMSARTVRMQNI